MTHNMYMHAQICTCCEQNNCKDCNCTCLIHDILAGVAAWEKGLVKTVWQFIRCKSSEGIDHCDCAVYLIQSALATWPWCALL